MIEKANVSHAIKFRTSLGSRNFSPSKISNFLFIKDVLILKGALWIESIALYALIFIQQSTDRNALR